MGDDPNCRGVSRRWIIREVESSLKRLATDWIDLYQIHRYEPDVDLEETLGALTDLVHQGKVRYIGSSVFPPSAIVQAQWAARDQHLERYVCEQPPYSMLARGIETDVLPTCQRYGIGVITWSPLSGGWLSGKWRKNAANRPAALAQAHRKRGLLSRSARRAAATPTCAAAVLRGGPPRRDPRRTEVAGRLGRHRPPTRPGGDRALRDQPRRPDADDGMTTIEVIEPATARAARAGCARRPAVPRSWPAAERGTAHSPTWTQT
jgi:Aldo/keto reductase family